MTDPQTSTTDPAGTLVGETWTVLDSGTTDPAGVLRAPTPPADLIVGAPAPTPPALLNPTPPAPVTDPAPIPPATG